MKNYLKVFFKGLGSTITKNASEILQAFIIGTGVLAINDMLHSRNFISDCKTASSALDEMKDETK